MLLLNFYRLVGASVLCSSPGVSVTYYNGKKAAITTDKNITTAALLYPAEKGSHFSPCIDRIAKKGSTSGVVFGTGDTPVAYEDYCLAGEIIDYSSFNETHISTVTAITGGVRVETTFTLTNITESEITIREMGLVACTWQMTLADYNQTLVERTVLNTPVTIAPGSIAQITYAVEWIFPTG